MAVYASNTVSITEESSTTRSTGYYGSSSSTGYGSEHGHADGDDMARHYYDEEDAGNTGN